METAENCLLLLEQLLCKSLIAELEYILRKRFGPLAASVPGLRQEVACFV